MQNIEHSATAPVEGVIHALADPSAYTVLIVEDSKVEQVRMLAMLQGFGYRVLTADDGRQALEMLRREPVRLVLSDWRMPELSGIQLCRALRADPEFGHPYVILVTGRNTKTDLIAGMDAGADDFIAKPFNGEELRVRVQAGVRLLELRSRDERRSRELAAALEREAEANRMIRSDLSLAARMQRATLPAPDSPFAQLEIGTFFHAATQVAGDSFDFFRLDDRHLAFFLIDVAGHGVASAMLSFTVSRFLSPETGAIALRSDTPAGPPNGQRMLPPGIVAPHQVVDALNRRFVDKDDCSHYFTMVYGVLDVETGCGELCQAGHPHPLVVASGDRVKRLARGGFPVGMLGEASYETFVFRLAPGERLVLYSDGITDCSNAAGEPFGEQRLANLLGAGHAQPLADGMTRLGEHLAQWRGNGAGVDDMSLLAIGRRVSGAPAGGS